MKELDDQVYSIGLQHSKQVKTVAEDFAKHVNEVHYTLADIKELIETEAVEK